MRGVYEKPEGSGIWWIHYYAAGKRHREKVGRKSDAIKLYQSRKADATAGRKLPELRDSKVVRFSELIDDALEFVIDHKDRRSYVSKAEIVRKAFGSTPAAEITPQELERWLRSHCKTPATANRYKAFISLCYREGVHNNKTTINPARQVRHRREGVGRLRFLTREEYDRLYKVIERRFPEHLAEFIISVSTGMRLSEQYSLTWGQVHLDRRTIDLTKTKNGSARTVHLNADSVAAFQTLKHKLHKTRRSGLRSTRPLASTHARGSSLACKTLKSKATYGTATVTRSAPGWRWRVHQSKKSRNLLGTRRLLCPLDTVISHQSTGFQ